MKKSIAILLGWTVLLSASRLFHPCVAVAANECVPVCLDTANACAEKAKGSPNEIGDRDLCQQDKVDCLKKCSEEIRQQSEENERQRILQDEENGRQRALKEQEQKDNWDAQGLTPEERQMEIQKQKQLEEDQQNEKYDELRRQKEQEKERWDQEQERLRKEKEQSDQAPQ
jgi:hypothetical protein